MKSRVGHVLVSLVLGALTLGSPVQAQNVERTIKANIPFDFVVGSKVFPAGRYSVVLIKPALLELRDSEGRALIDVLTHSVQASALASRPKLRFDSEGGQHVLTQVWQEDDFIGEQVLRRKLPALAVRQRAGHVQTAEAGNPR